MGSSGKLKRGARLQSKGKMLSLIDYPYLMAHLPTEHGDNSERLNRLYKALPNAIKTLTPLQREVIFLMYNMGLTQTQVADRRKVNKSTICRTHKRAIKRLQDLLQFLL